MRLMKGEKSMEAELTTEEVEAFLRRPPDIEPWDLSIKIKQTITFLFF